MFTIDDYLCLLNDEKPITIRQCVQSLLKIIPYKKNLLKKIAESIMKLEIGGIRETMRMLDKKAVKHIEAMM